MPAFKNRTQRKSVAFDGTDLKVKIQLFEGDLVIAVYKGDCCVHTVVIDEAEEPIENAWLADMFAREDRIELRKLATDVDNYLLSTNINQG